MKKRIVLDFLEKYGMSYETIDINENCQKFIREMKRGLEGKTSSLRMIPTCITIDKQIPTEEPIIALDAGGTNFRAAVCYFNKEKRPVVENFKTYPMPGSDGEISKEEFFDILADYIRDYLPHSSKIGFCFSYPTKVLPNKDGRLIQFSKEIKVKDLVGVAIGESLLNTIRQKGDKLHRHIVLINDTVATLLGGKSAFPDRCYDSYIGFILGTGMNTCYIEQNTNIKKVNDIIEKPGSTIINIESGAYNKMPVGFIDKEFDSKTANPGEYVFEKMISGKYQGDLILTVAKRAAKEGMFSKKFTENIDKINKLSTKQVNHFLYYPYSGNILSNCCLHEDDRIILFHIIDCIVERAAKLAAINLSAIMLKTEKGKNPCKPVCISTEGSTFYNHKLFKDKLYFYIKDYLEDEKGIYCEFVKSENATLIGAAIAGLLN